MATAIVNSEAQVRVSPQTPVIGAKFDRVSRNKSPSRNEIEQVLQTIPQSEVQFFRNQKTIDEPIATKVNDQSYLVPLVRSQVQNNLNEETKTVEREFGEEFRSPNFLSGWFILPSALVFVFFAVCASFI